MCRSRSGQFIAARDTDSQFILARLICPQRQSRCRIDTIYSVAAACFPIFCARGSVDPGRPKMDIECQTLSVPEAGKILGVSRNTAYDAVKTGQLPVLRIGRKIRVPKVLLHRMLASTPGKGECPMTGTDIEATRTDFIYEALPAD